MLALQMHLEEVVKGCFQLHLHVPKLLIDFIPEDLTENRHVIILSRVDLNGRHNRVRSLDSQALKYSYFYL